MPQSKHTCGPRPEEINVDFHSTSMQHLYLHPTIVDMGDIETSVCTTTSGHYQILHGTNVQNGMPPLAIEDIVGRID